MLKVVKKDEKYPHTFVIIRQNMRSECNQKYLTATKY